MEFVQTKFITNIVVCLSEYYTLLACLQIHVWTKILRHRYRKRVMNYDVLWKLLHGFHSVIIYIYCFHLFLNLGQSFAK